MATNTRLYQKLPGRASSFLGVTRLWFAPDHLLSVTGNSLGIETYRRFYFHQIKSLIALRTSRRLAWNCVLGGLGGVCAGVGALFLFGAGSVTNGDRNLFLGFGSIFLGLAAFFLLGFLLNSLLGPILLLYVHTPSGIERLGAPLRAGAMSRLQSKLLPLIRQSQPEPVEPGAVPASAIPEG